MRNAAWAANVVAQAVLFLALHFRGRHAWPVARAWLAASVASAVILARFAPSSHEYLIAYAALEPVMAALLVAVLAELLAARSSRFAAGVGRAWWWLAGIAAIAATAAAVLVSEPAWRRPLLLWLWHARQWFTAGYAIAADGSLALLSAYRVDVAAQVARHHRFLTAYAALQAAGMVAVRSRAADANTAILALGAALSLAWAWGVRPVEVLPPPMRGPEADRADADQAALWRVIGRLRGRVR